MALKTDPATSSQLDPRRVTLVYTMFHHLGDFIVMGGLLKKFDEFKVEFKSLIVHQNSPYISLFDGVKKNRFFNVYNLSQVGQLVVTLRKHKKNGGIILGLPMAPGSFQAYLFFLLLKKCGALTHLVDFNLANADIITPPRRRYIFDRHLAQAAELFKQSELIEDTSMPLCFAKPDLSQKGGALLVGLYPISARSRLPEFSWPEARWRELIRLILENAEVNIVMIGRGREFKALTECLHDSLPLELQNRFIVSVTTSVSDLTGALQSLDYLITVNTSALHIAHALKIPLVAICGSSLESWLPEGEHVRLVRDGSAALPPSDKYYHDPLQPSVQRIQVAEVFEAYLELKKSLEKNKSRSGNRA